MVRHSRKGGQARQSKVSSLGLPKPGYQRTEVQPAAAPPSLTTGGPDPHVQNKQLMLAQEAARKGEDEQAAQSQQGRTFFGYFPGAKVIGVQKNGGRKSRKLGTTFNRCVKSVRKTVKTRKGSTKESAAIAICTTSVLYPRGRTMKRYRKGRLVTQRRRVR